MKQFDSYDKVLLCGAALMGKLVYEQIKNSKSIIGVISTIPKNNRVEERFFDYSIDSPARFKSEVRNGNVAVVICMGYTNAIGAIHTLVRLYDYPNECIFMPNPFSSCRPTCIDDDKAKDKRYSLDDERYDLVRGMFGDGESLRLYDHIFKSPTYDFLGDKYQLIPYSSIKDILIKNELYWEYLDDFNIKGTDSATVFDFGAYIGDSVRDICCSIAESRIYYYAFEPDKENYSALSELAAEVDYCEFFSPMNVAVGPSNGTMYLDILQNDKG